MAIVEPRSKHRIDAHGVRSPRTPPNQTRSSPPPPPPRSRTCLGARFSIGCFRRFAVATTVDAGRSWPPDTVSVPSGPRPAAMHPVKTASRWGGGRGRLDLRRQPAPPYTPLLPAGVRRRVLKTVEQLDTRSGARGSRNSPPHPLLTAGCRVFFPPSRGEGGWPHPHPCSTHSTRCGPPTLKDPCTRPVQRRGQETLIGQQLRMVRQIHRHSGWRGQAGLGKGSEVGGGGRRSPPCCSHRRTRPPRNTWGVMELMSQVLVCPAVVAPGRFPFSGCRRRSCETRGEGGVAGVRPSRRLLAGSSGASGSQTSPPCPALTAPGPALAPSTPPRPFLLTQPGIPRAAGWGAPRRWGDAPSRVGVRPGGRQGAATWPICLRITS